VIYSVRGITIMSEPPARLLRVLVPVLENATYAAFVMALFSGFVFGGAVTAMLLSRMSCIGG
jgi:hypothetical protein